MHAELVVELFGVQILPSLSAPGTDCIEAEAGEEDDVLLDAVKAELYRGIAPCCNYLAVDRPELQFAVRESCREMSKPTVGSWSKLLRIGRYLKGQPRLVWMFGLQILPMVMDVYSDAHWAACHRIRKSTGGGIAMLGSHVEDVKRHSIADCQESC